MSLGIGMGDVMGLRRLSKKDLGKIRGGMMSLDDGAGCTPGVGGCSGQTPICWTPNQTPVCIESARGTCYWACQGSIL